MHYGLRTQHNTQTQDRAWEHYWLNIKQTQTQEIVWERARVSKGVIDHMDNGRKQATINGMRGEIVEQLLSARLLPVATSTCNPRALIEII
jgi:hypothetical protein